MTTTDPNFPRLVVTDPAEHEGLVLSLSLPEMVIGHSDTADLVLDDHFVSRRHALITVALTGSVTIRDLNSTGGTFVNDEQLRGSRVLRRGDLVRFADLVARFEPADAPRDADTAAMPVLAAADTGGEVPPTSGSAAAASADTRVMNRQPPIPEPAASSGDEGNAGSEEAETDASGQPDVSPITSGAGAAAEPMGGDPGGPSEHGRIGNPNFYEIHGTVAGRNGDPLRGARVIVWRQHIRERTELAAGAASEHGRYHLRYRVPENAPEPLLLVVEARSEHLDAPLFSALTAAQPDLEIDLSLEPPDKSEWATLVRSMEPLLDGLELSELIENSTHQDISFLARELGQSTEVVMRVAVSARLEAAFKIPAPAFYAFLCQQVPAALPSPLLDASQNFTLIAPLVQRIGSLIFSLTAQVQTQTLTAAVALDLIGPQFTTQIPRLVSELQALQPTDLLNQPYLVGNTTLAQLLDVAALAPDKQQTFAQALSTNTQSMRNFWRTLGDGQHGFTAAEASGIERTLSIGAFVKNFVPLVQNLLQGFSSGTYSTLPDLARLTLQDWVQLVSQTGPPPGIDAAGTATPTQVFASVVYTRTTRAYPTAALSGRIAAGTFVPQAQQRPLIQFFGNNPDLELIKDNIPAYLASHGDTAFARLSGEDQAMVIANARSFQRVLRVAPDPDVAQTLLGLGIKSATQIATLGQQQFFLKATAAGLTRPEANQAFQAAAQRYANVVSLYTQLNRDSIGIWPKAMGQVSGLDQPMQEAIQFDPSLTTLFGSQDYCATDDCTSILSPAAYLCDLLLWLRNHQEGAQTALDVLDSRRPDIRHLLLNCPNTDTELPYIDLVNELLADTISPPIDAISTSYVQEALVNGTTYYYIVTSVNSVGQGAPSSQVSAAPAAPAAAPAAPGALSATPGDTQVTLSWNAVPAAVSYNIYWSTSPGVTTANGTEIPGAANPYTQTALVNGTTYYYIVTSANSAGESPPSSQVSAAPIVPTIAPPAPTGVSATPGDNQVTLAWNAVAGATGYNVYWSTAPGVTTANGTEITGTWNPVWKQTSADTTAADLSAAPEYFNQGAYVTLFAASYPFTLPYSAGLDELRTYLQQLNLPLWQLRQALLPLGGATVPQQAAVAAERFGMAPHAEDLAANPNFVPAPVAWNTANPLTDVAPVDAFLQAASLSYESLLELLQVSWVQGPLNVAIQGIDDTCMTSSQSLAPLVGSDGLGFLDRAHRFLRVWLCTGYRMWELDLLLGAPAVANGTLDQSALAALLSFRQLQDATRLAVDQQLAFYQNIDTATHRDPDGTTTVSLYAQIFLNAAVTSVAPDPDLAALPTGGTIADPVLSDHLAGIQAALGISAADAATLFGLTDNQLTLANLSSIYRVNALATASKLSISGLLLVADLLSPAAANPAAALAPLLTSPAATLSFLAQAAAIQQPDLTLDAITYVLTPPDATTLTSPITISQTSITVASDTGFPAPNFYISIGSETLLVTAVSGADNTIWTVARGQQGTAAAPAATGAAVGLTGGWATTTQMTQANIATTLSAVQQAVVSLLAASTTLASGITAGQTSITVVSDTGFPAPNFSVTIGSEILLVTAVGGTGNTTWTVARGQQGTTAAPAATGAAVTPTGGDVNGSVIAAVAANAHTASASGLANDVSALILQQLQVPGSGLTLLTVLTDPAFTGSSSPLTPTSFPSQFLAIQLFDKVAVLVRGLRLVATDLSWLLANAAVYNGLNFSQLPVTPGQPVPGLPPLLTTLLVIKLARLWTAAPPSSSVQTLYDVIGGVSAGTLASGAQAQGALAAITGWPLTDIEAFASALGCAFPANYTQPPAYDALRPLEAMAAKAGAAGAQIVNWGAVPPDEPTAEGIAAGALGVVKAQQPGNDAWLALAPTLMNPIRENRSAALQAYLTAQRDGSGDLIYPDADHLFDYFLIDVQMSSCQATSRVVQAYIAVQIFVARCLMNLEAPEVVVDLTQDDTWNQWEWMSSYRVWEANREVLLYPENWLIESQRSDRTEIYQQLEQEVRQGQSTADYLETVVLNYIDRLDGLAHLLVTGTCEDPATGTIYVVARTLADPPVFYLRSFLNGAWTGWAQITINIKAHQAVPALYRGRVCLFWLEVKVSNEPQQALPAAQQSSAPPSQTVDKYVSLAVNFSIFRNGNWSPAQAAKGKLFDKPFYDQTKVSDIQAVEALYTLKVQAPAPAPGYGANLFLDVFRQGDFQVWNWGWLGDPNVNLITSENDSVATHLGRAVFDGRFSDLELRNLEVPTTAQTSTGVLPAGYTLAVPLLTHAQAAYGLDAQPLLPLPDSQADPDLAADSGLIPRAGALASLPADPAQGPAQTLVLNFTSAGALEQSVGPLLNTAPVPLRVVGPVSDLNFDPTSYFFFQDNRRCYWVQSTKYYWTGSFWSPVVPSDPSTVPYQISYVFHPFYQPFTRLFWNQLSGGGFDLLYDPDLQQVPDTIDPSYSEVFSFQIGYQPTWRVTWDLADASTALASPISASQTTITVTNNIWVPSPAFYVFVGSEILLVTAVGSTDDTSWTVTRGQQGTSPAAAPGGAAVTPTAASQDRQFLDFSSGAPFSVYNWELFYHIPLYIAQLLSQNQQFEDAQTWFQYIFNPTRQGSAPAPQRFWIPKPLHDLTSAKILQQQINNLLEAVNQGNPAAVAEINTWRNDPFNPFVLADQRPVAYMKSTVMSYLDNLIAWGDNLFSTESREALSEATLLYVIASEILGPQPVAVTPPQSADESFDQLEPSLDAFANAMVEIENVIGGAGSGAGGSGAGGSGGIPVAQTFYFKIPSNAQLLGYWATVADRLYKLRHCQNIAGAALQLALFDAPIDPGLLIAAQAAGVDLSSVLSDVAAPLPNYRFTSLYPQALDFVNAVRAYGASLQAALEKADAGALALLQSSTQQQLLTDADQIFQSRADQAQNAIDALNQGLAVLQSTYDYYSGLPHQNEAEGIAASLSQLAFLVKHGVPILKGLASLFHAAPNAGAGVAGAGGTPQAQVTEGGSNAGHSTDKGSQVVAEIVSLMEDGAKLATEQGRLDYRYADNQQKATEAELKIQQANTQIAGAELALQIAGVDQANHQEQIDNLQKQIDFLTDKFTSDSLYDWMVGSLSATYFQSYQLAYQMCKQVERCYQFELGIQDSSFIQFGYWDSLYKGLLAGETLNHDLRRMQASYLQQNARRYELSRYVSLGVLNPAALQQLLVTGACDFTLPESLFDNDYPGHYNRRLTRVSLTVVYPSPGKFDNVKATLTLAANQVRINTDTSSGYAENPVGSDPRFIYNYAAVPQKIAMGNAQDDPGLFITAIASNIADQRYLPFENAGAISSWHLEMPQLYNEVDLSTVGDIVLHLYYTALDGGAPLQQAAQANNAANLPTSGIKVFSAQNDFAAPSPTAANPYPLTPWQAFLATVAAPANQTLTLSISPSKFPAWTRGKTISVTSLAVLAVAWPPGDFVLAPQAPLPTASVPMTPVAGVTEPNVCAATIAMPVDTPLGTWSFELQQQGAPDFRSLTKNEIGDVVLLVSYDVS